MDHVHVKVLCLAQRDEFLNSNAGFHTFVELSNYTDSMLVSVCQVDSFFD